jgi:oligopeptidase B
VVWAGVAPPGWTTSVPRQAIDSTEPLLDPPVAVPDPYGWMRDESRQETRVLEHLRRENEYTHALTRHLTDPIGNKQGTSENNPETSGSSSSVVDQLYEEMLSAIQETDYTTPRPDQEYVYYTRTLRGKAYTLHCRAPRSSLANSSLLWQDDMTEEEKMNSPVRKDEQIILNVNQLAENQSYCSTGAVRKSPSHQYLAYAVDFSGDEKCHMYVRHLESETLVHEDPDLEISGSLQWGADDHTLFYIRQDEAHRPYQVYRRTFTSLEKNSPNATQPWKDEMIFEELNDLYYVGFYKSLDGRYLFIESSSKETTEIYYLDLNNPADLQSVAPRRPKVLYEVEHKDDTWWILSNVGGLPNMALFTSPAVPNSQDQWQLVQHADTKQPIFDGGYAQSLDHLSCFQNHVVASGRQGGLPRIWVLGIIQSNNHHLDGSTTTTTVEQFEMLKFAEEAYDVSMGTHYEYKTDSIVVTYDSMITPTQSIEIQLDDTSQRRVLKERFVPGYEKELYACERLTVTARDGTTEIPVSMVYRKDVMEQHLQQVQKQRVDSAATTDGERSILPVHLYGYGSYGSCMEADFVSTRLPLLNRGMVYVIAHVRGGGEMGRTWYEEPNGAKYLCKKNTFTDFVDVAKWLIETRKLTSSQMLSCEGRSAGGLLIGASINLAPELFRVAVLGVPFVDVVATMIDASIPLTAAEWEEWGNPNEGKYHQYMMEYNPMTNVKHAVYPACLLTGGLHDPRVQVCGL